jgi:hypothetical protein
MKNEKWKMKKEPRWRMWGSAGEECAEIERRPERVDGRVVSVDEDVGVNENAGHGSPIPPRRETPSRCERDDRTLGAWKATA